MFSRNKQTLESCDQKLAELQAHRETLLTRRDAILMDVAENPAAIDRHQREFQSVDLGLQSIPMQVERWQSRRREIEQAAALKEYTECKAEFVKARALAEKIAAAQRKEIARTNIMPGQYMRLLNQQTDIVSGFQQRALSLLKTLDMTPDEQTRAREQLLFSRLDMGGNIAEFEALYALMLPEIIAELEVRFGVVLGVIDG